MAMYIIAYMRDSWSGLSSGAMQAAVAASPAFTLQRRTASSEAAAPMGARGRAGLDPLAASCGQLEATHADTRTAATARFFMTPSPHPACAPCGSFLCSPRSAER